MNKKRKINYFIPIAILAGIGLAIYTSNKPFQVYKQEKAKADEMRTELDGLQKSNVKLKEKDQIMNPVQKEEEARRMGYVRPDERTLPDKSSNTPEVKAPEVTTRAKKPEPTTPPIDLRESDKNEEIKADPQ